MSKGQHTPGPWDYVVVASDNEVMAGCWVRAHGCDWPPRLVCKVLDSDDYPAVPDARLIAAAPELLAALIALIPLANDGSTRKSHQALVAAAKAAIAKATSSPGY